MSTTDRDQANFPIAPLPLALRERVMAASLLARGAGETVPAVPAISADEAFERFDAEREFLHGQSALGAEAALAQLRSNYPGLDVQEPITLPRTTIVPSRALKPYRVHLAIVPPQP